jgi:lysine 2,3-aminomutase
MEVTPEARQAIQRLLSAGWIVTNQLVMSAAASRRGHSAKLRQVLNDVGVLPYYTFVLKGYRENQFNYAPIARVVQEELEEKVFGRIPEKYQERVRHLPDSAPVLADNVAAIRQMTGLPFLATDRSVLNLPAVGKSLTFRVIGVTRYGRRILEFDHDRTRAHSPIIDRMGKVIIIESKSIGEYLRQLEEIGEDSTEYEDVWGYSLGQTEGRVPVYEYPEYDFTVTDEVTNFRLDDDTAASEEAGAAVE